MVYNIGSMFAFISFKRRNQSSDVELKIVAITGSVWCSSFCIRQRRKQN